jgi:[ribosomal protein S5]-alanine N-acetyltransferase
MAGRRVVLRRPTMADRDQFLALARRSRGLHRRWAHPPRDAWAFRAFVDSARGSRGVRFLVCRREDGAIVGVVNLNEIVRGALQSAFVGYYAFAGATGQGLMTEGVRLALRVAFEVLRLHRVEANVQPGNRRSLALALRCGFRREGFSPRYLKIGGRWCDHERLAVVRGDPASSVNAPRAAAGSGAVPGVAAEDRSRRRAAVRRGARRTTSAPRRPRCRTPPYARCRGGTRRTGRRR